MTTPCDIVVTDETGILPLLDGTDVLVTMTLTAEMGRAAKRLKLVQVPGAGLDRIDRAALPRDAMLANAYGHETGIAEYVIGAMLALTREFARLDSALRAADWQSQWAGSAASGLARTRRQDDRDSRLWPDRPEHRPPRSRLWHAGLCDPPRSRPIGRG